MCYAYIPIKGRKDQGNSLPGFKKARKMTLILRLRFWFQNLLMTFGVVRRPCSISDLTMRKQKHFLRKHKRQRDSHSQIRKIKLLEAELSEERLDNVLTMNAIMIGYEEQIAEQRELLLSINEMLKDTMKHQTPALTREKYSHNYFNKSIEEIVKIINTYMSSKGNGL